VGDLGGPGREDGGCASRTGLDMVCRQGPIAGSVPVVDGPSAVVAVAVAVVSDYGWPAARTDLQTLEQLLEVCPHRR